MATSLAGRQINNSFKDLLQVSNENAGIDSTLRTVSDGEGTESPLRLSSSAVEVAGNINTRGGTSGLVLLNSAGTWGYKVRPNTSDINDYGLMIETTAGDNLMSIRGNDKAGGNENDSKGVCVTIGDVGATNPSADGSNLIVCHPGETIQGSGKGWGGIEISAYEASTVDSSGTYDKDGTRSFRIRHYGTNASGTKIEQRENAPLRFLTDNAERLTIAGNGRIGIGNTSPDATIEVKQASSSGGIPVMELHQVDRDQPFINFSGSSASGSTRNISSSTATNAQKKGAIRVEIEGVTRWIRFYNSAG